MSDQDATLGRRPGTLPRRAPGPRLALALCALSVGCSVIGDPGGRPEGLPHGGTGQFRFLDQDESGISGALTGRAIFLRNAAVGAAMVHGGALFYALSDRIDEPPDEPEDHPPREVFTPAYEPSTIHRSTPFEEGNGTFAAGPVVLGLEGADVRDPWVVSDEAGGARMFVTTDRGIELTTAASPDSPFSGLGGDPIVVADPGAPGAPPRRPSVIEDGAGGWLLYYEQAGAVFVASSADGRSFSPEGQVELLGEDAGASPEVRVGSPGAVRVVTEAGRAIFRLYFESEREDGARQVYVAGGEDGRTFERHPRPVLDHDDARDPAPLVVDSRLTLLYVNVPFRERGYQVRGIAVSVGPGGHRFVPAETTP